MKSNKAISELIKEFIPLFNSFEQIYLFGSILKPCVQSNDIDILIIYKKYSKKLGDDLKLFSEEIEKASGMMVDLTALSIEEEREVSFLERIKSNILRLK